MALIVVMVVFELVTKWGAFRDRLYLYVVFEILAYGDFVFRYVFYDEVFYF